MRTFKLLSGAALLVTIVSRSPACDVPAERCEPCPPGDAHFDSSGPFEAQPVLSGGPSTPLITLDVTATSFAFTPSAAIVPAGAIVRWTNIDFTGHSAVSQTGNGTLIPSGVWMSPILEANQSFSFTADVPTGIYWYFCEPHSGIMRGSIEVRRPGDADGSGSIDLDDFTTLASNFGLNSRTYPQGDFNLDRTVNLDDFTVLAANFGHGAPAHAARAATVPEPASTMFLSAGGVLACRRRNFWFCRNDSA